jgi:hypothetical protein
MSAKKSSLPECGRPGCNSKVTKSRNKYCSPACSQLDQREDSRLPTDSFEVSGDTAHVTRILGQRVTTPEEFFERCQIDRSIWHVVELKCKKWDMGAVLRAQAGSVSMDQPTVVELFAVSATLKLKVDVIAARNEIKTLIVDAKQHIGPRPKVKRTHSGAHLLEISIPDLHIGKLAWAPETGYANYDSKIAEQLFKEALETLIIRTSHLHFNRVLLVVGNDLLHADTKQGTTTGGTQLDTDTRFHKTFLLARRMITDAIERLREIAPVDVVMVPGNHDNLSVWHLGDSLECFYHQTEDVTIFNSPNPRKYYEFGKVMLLLTHGDKGKHPDYPLMMATEEKDMWQRTKYREAHLGHLHTTRASRHIWSHDVKEEHGVKVRILPSLAAADAWHSENHYVGNHRSAEAYVWHPDEGLITQAQYTVQD